jgi:AGZA family xanthine/uracil permease-like MFS transporter
MMPLTFSIANGIAMGFITYTIMKVCTGQRSRISTAMYVLCAIFVAKFIFL